MIMAPVLLSASVVTVEIVEAPGAAFQSGSVCNTRTLCHGWHS